MINTNSLKNSHSNNQIVLESAESIFNQTNFHTHKTNAIQGPNLAKNYSENTNRTFQHKKFK